MAFFILFIGCSDNPQKPNSFNVEASPAAQNAQNYRHIYLISPEGKIVVHWKADEATIVDSLHELQWNDEKGRHHRYFYIGVNSLYITEIPVEVDVLGHIK